jgi:hypothetical protein
MIRRIVFIAAFLLNFQISFGQNEFERVYGGLLNERFHMAIPVADGRILAGGSTSSYGNGNIFNNDFYLVKISAAGDTIWKRSFGTPNDDDGRAVAEFAGGYVIAGFSINPLNGSYDYHVVKTDTDGNVLWDNYYGGTAADYGVNVLVVNDSTLAMVGNSSSFTNGGFDVYVVVLNGEGVQLNDAHFGGTLTETSYGIGLAKDGGFIICGYSAAGSSTNDVYLLKIDSGLNFQWSQTFGETGFDIGFDVDATDDGGYMVLAVWQNSADSSEIALIKTDSAGLNPVIKYPGTHAGDYAFKLCRLNDGYAISGATNDQEKQAEMLVIKTNLAGDTIWSRHYGGFKNETALGIAAFGNGDLLVSGESEGFGTENFDAYLVRVNANGDIPCPSSVSFIESDSSFCEDETVFLTNTTVSSQQFAWNVDGSFFSNSINTSFYFADPGMHEITLTACSTSVTHTLESFSKPPAHFDVSVQGLTAAFSVSPNLIPAHFLWNFGDGSPADTTNLNPSHSYSSAAAYWVVLSCTDEHGCDSSYAEQINLFTAVADPSVQNVSLEVIPNLLHESANILLDGKFQFPLVAKVFDLEGRMKKEIMVTKNQQSFSVADLASGAYVIKIFSAGSSLFSKFVVE